MIQRRQTQVRVQKQQTQQQERSASRAVASEALVARQAAALLEMQQLAELANGVDGGVISSAPVIMVTSGGAARADLIDRRSSAAHNSRGTAGGASSTAVPTARITPAGAHEAAYVPSAKEAATSEAAVVARGEEKALDAERRAQAAAEALRTLTADKVDEEAVEEARVEAARLAASAERVRTAVAAEALLAKAQSRVSVLREEMAVASERAKGAPPAQRAAAEEAAADIASALEAETSSVVARAEKVMEAARAQMVAAHDQVNELAASGSADDHAIAAAKAEMVQRAQEAQAASQAVNVALQCVAVVTVQSAPSPPPEKDAKREATLHSALIPPHGLTQIKSQPVLSSFFHGLDSEASWTGRDPSTDPPRSYEAPVQAQSAGAGSNWRLRISGRLQQATGQAERMDVGDVVNATVEMHARITAETPGFRRRTRPPPMLPKPRTDKSIGLPPLAEAKAKA